jgi:hypothetical protein
MCWSTLSPNFREAETRGAFEISPERGCFFRDERNEIVLVLDVGSLFIGYGVLCVLKIVADTSDVPFQDFGSRAKGRVLNEKSVCVSLSGATASQFPG